MSGWVDVTGALPMELLVERFGVNLLCMPEVFCGWFSRLVQTLSGLRTPVLVVRSTPWRPC